MTNFTTRRRTGTVSFARFKLGLSQQQLADILGVSRSFIAMFETGKRKFPRSVAVIYNELCKKAAIVNPDGEIMVKRGRKSNLSQVGGHPSLVVTNCSNESFHTSKDPIVHWLEARRLTCLCHHTALQLKRRAAGERRQRLSEELMCVSAVLDASTKLLTVLPEGRTRKKYERKTACLRIRQQKIDQQLNKYGPVGLLQAEFQMRLLETRWRMTETQIDRLESSNCPHEGNTGIMEKDVRGWQWVGLVA